MSTIRILLFVMLKRLGLFALLKSSALGIIVLTLLSITDSFSVRAQGRSYEILNLKISPSSPDTLAVGQHISFTYDYDQPDDTVKLVVLPVFKGPGSSLTSSTRTITDPFGSSSGFVSISDTGKVTGILFRWFNSKGVILERTFKVNFTFIKYDISNIKFSPPSPSTLLSGKSVTFTYDYLQSFEDTVMMYAVAIFEGTGQDYRSFTQEISTTTGSASGSVTVVGEGHISAILFRIFDPNAGNGFLYEEEVPVDYTYKKYDISNVKFTPPSPDTLISGKSVTFTYDYLQSFGDTVMMYAVAIFEGTGQDYRSFTQEISTTTGSASGSVTVVGEGHISAILFRIFDPKAGNGFLYEEEVPVDYTFLKYAITNIRFAPASPDTLIVGEPVVFTYDYIKTTDTLTLIAIPSYTGSLTRIGSGNLTFTAPSGSGQGFFTLPDSGHVSELTLRLYKGDVKVYETSVPANFHFFDYNISNVVFSPPSPDTLPLSETVKFSYSYFQNSGTIKLVASPTYKGKGMGYSSSATRTFTTPTGTNTGYIGLLTDGKVDAITFRMFADTGTVYTKTYKVNYTFGVPIITDMEPAMIGSGLQLFPNPASDHLTIRCSSPNFRYEMIDVSGRVVKQEEVSGNEVSIPTHGLGKGIYTLKINDGDVTEFRKAVLQ